MPILTFLSDSHQAHNPPAEYLHGHTVPYYESPARVDQLQTALQAAGLLDLRQADTIASDVLSHTHDPEMVDYLRHLSTQSQHLIRADFNVYDLADRLSGDEYYYESMFPAHMQRTNGHTRRYTRRTFIYDNTSPVGRGTWDAALSAASAAYAGAQALLDGMKQAYALCRPPGHHAGYAMMGGYCYLNNAAIAANHLKAGGRVAILDVDYHHGNGTQDIFADDADVLYVSIHADPAVDYPYYSGFVIENTPTTCNLPLPHGTDEPAYLAALDEALAVIRGFQPAYLIVSLGFDIYHDDPMGHFNIHTPIFSEIGSRIAAVALPTLYVQEGGYNLDMLGEMAVTFFRAVLEA